MTVNLYLFVGEQQRAADTVSHQNKEAGLCGRGDTRGSNVAGHVSAGPLIREGDRLWSSSAGHLFIRWSGVEKRSNLRSVISVTTGATILPSGSSGTFYLFKSDKDNGRPDGCRFTHREAYILLFHARGKCSPRL